MARILTPAFAFWPGGLLPAWARRRDAPPTAQVGRCSLKGARQLKDLLGFCRRGLVLAALALVTLSALAAERATLPALAATTGELLLAAALAVGIDVAIPD